MKMSNVLTQPRQLFDRFQRHLANSSVKSRPVLSHSHCRWEGEPAKERTDPCLLIYAEIKKTELSAHTLLQLRVYHHQYGAFRCGVKRKQRDRKTVSRVKVKRATKICCGNAFRRTAREIVGLPAMSLTHGIIPPGNADRWSLTQDHILRGH